MLIGEIKTANSLPHSLYRAEQVKSFEGEAAILAATTLYGLMNRAGTACYHLLLQAFPKAKHILVFCGLGNNGGDGYIFAKQARSQGLSVQLCQIGDADNLQGDAGKARDEWLSAGGCIEAVHCADFAKADLVLDALLGTGLKGNVRPLYKALIRQINQADKAVLSVDIPSGLNADTGAVSSIAVKATATLSFVALKQGLFTGQANDYCGQIYFADLGVNKHFNALCLPSSQAIFYNEMSYYLGKRERCCHKGDFGRCLVIGGNWGMPGAVRLASEAALRTGAGLVKVLTVQANFSTVLAGRPELMVTDLSDNEETYCWATQLIIGPGLGRDDWAEALFDEVKKRPQAMVVDADALNLLALDPTYKDNWILTPHPKEAANLLACSVEQVEADRFTAVNRLQKKFGGVVILKGVGTLICDGKQIYLANAGNPGMASGGMGDVLSGIIGGLLAQGLNLIQAAKLAVTLHGLAADLASEQGERGLLASDLFLYIRKLVNR